MDLQEEKKEWKCDCWKSTKHLLLIEMFNYKFLCSFKLVSKEKANRWKWNKVKDVPKLNWNVNEWIEEKKFVGQRWQVWKILLGHMYDDNKIANRFE